MSERIYGLHAVRALLRRHPQRVRALWLQSGRDDARLREIEVLAGPSGQQPQRLAAAQLQRLVGDVAHQGVVAEIDPLPTMGEAELLEALGGAGDPLLLVLDGVQDPHNLGACLRTADACGAVAVVIPKDRATQLTPTARKVAAGAAESTPVVRVTNLARSLEHFKAAGLWVVGADASAPQAVYEADLTGGRALVLGAEGSGLRELTRRHCDLLVSLPQAGSVESLNVSVAAGMLLYEALRQRRKA